MTGKKSISHVLRQVGMGNTKERTSQWEFALRKKTGLSVRTRLALLLTGVGTGDKTLWGKSAKVENRLKKGVFLEQKVFPWGRPPTEFMAGENRRSEMSKTTSNVQ